MHRNLSTDRISHAGAIETIMLDSSRGGVESWLHYGEQAVQKRVTERKKNAGSKTLVCVNPLGFLMESKGQQVLRA